MDRTFTSYMLDFQVQKSTRKCHKTDRKFVAGESFYSVLIPQGADVIRQDYCQDAWEGAPQDVIGWWKSTMPDHDNQKLNLAPNEVMLHYFEQLRRNPQSQDLAYVLALLMVRKRLMRLEGTEQDHQGQELMILSDPKNETEYKVAVRQPSIEKIEELQQELAGMLYKDAA
ncbi:MAG: hypothetical protein VX738_00200 [Planctomycetota bacterium]|nr:hypothetical protein [Planctomycetota bacterium]